MMNSMKGATGLIRGWRVVHLLLAAHLLLPLTPSSAGMRQSDARAGKFCPTCGKAQS